MKKYLFGALVFCAFVAGIFMAGQVSASVPVLSLQNLNNGEDVQVTVNGDINSSVLLHYVKTGVGQQVVLIGNTNSNGYFTEKINSPDFGIVSNSLVHVTLKGINGEASNEATWPAVSSSGNFYLSQTSVVVATGQSATVTANNAGSIYLSTNSNPQIANININGSQIYIYGSTAGSTTATICTTGNYRTCQSLYITVSASGTWTQARISLSSSALSLTYGNTATFTVTAIGFASPYYYLNDSFSGTSVSNSNINSSGYFNWTPRQSDIGTHNVTVFAYDLSGHSATATVQITVNSGSVNPVYGVFNRMLYYGDTGSDVSELQKFLARQGYLSIAPTGYFGPNTTLALKKFQSARGLPAVGYVDLQTKNLLNTLVSQSGTGYMTEAERQEKIRLIQQAIQLLLQQLALLQ